MFLGLRGSLIGRRGLGELVKDPCDLLSFGVVGLFLGPWYGVMPIRYRKKYGG